MQFKLTRVGKIFDVLKKKKTKKKLFHSVIFKDIMSIAYLISVESNCIAQLVGHLTGKSEVLGSIPGLTTYFCFSFC